jgi:hypothetical protein
MKKTVNAQTVWNEFYRDCSFKAGLNLYETVEGNENFYIGKQWENVRSNGLPTPVFNFIKRIILYVVASTSTDNLKMNASPLSSSLAVPLNVDMPRLIQIINSQFVALFEQNKVGKQSREFMRNAAVDGDACIYSWFDPEAETGQTAKGTIRTEILENTRVGFGDPNNRDVQSQPYILISRREMLDRVKEEAKKNNGEADAIISDSDETNNHFSSLTEGKVTTVVRFWKEDGKVWAIKIVNNAIVRPKWDTGMKLYPITWMNWDYIQNCYHGQAAVTGLIPNQIFVNKMFAMVMVSLMTTAYPKIVYDKTRIARWDSGVGKAIPVNGGDVTNVAKAIDPAAISPQVAQFIELAIGLTKEFMGATDAALGDTRPDNTSAIIALQKASSVPMELTKQNLLQSVEDMGRIYMDFMAKYYGTRSVEVESPLEPGKKMILTFDFSALKNVPCSIDLDAGAASYWSEIAAMQTLDNLLMQGKISTVEYLKRLPAGQITDRDALVEVLQRDQMMQMGMMPPEMGGQNPSPTDNAEPPLRGGPGNAALQRKINQTGEVPGM